METSIYKACAIRYRFTKANQIQQNVRFVVFHCRPELTKVSGSQEDANGKSLVSLMMLLSPPVDTDMRALSAQATTPKQKASETGSRMLDRTQFKSLFSFETVGQARYLPEENLQCRSPDASTSYTGSGANPNREPDLFVRRYSHCAAMSL